MSEKDEQGFVIRDRRGRGERPGEGIHEPASSPASGAEASSGHAHGTAPGIDSAPPISFSSFVFSLGTSALMLMGEQVDPNQPKVPVNMAQAKEIVDILSLLEDKTRGNLSSEEQSVLHDMLYALRMKYVDLVSGKPASPTTP